jgi:RNA polymerase sigma-70 factor (ECF subfamily)
VNCSKNYLVAVGRKPPANDIDAEEAEVYDGAEQLRSNASPENLLMSEEVKETIFRTIEGLPEDLKTAITLREIEGMSYEEIAVVMDCPVGTVRSRIFRAREAIDNNLNSLTGES